MARTSMSIQIGSMTEMHACAPRRRRFSGALLPLFATAVTTCAVRTAEAADFKWGDFDGTFTSTLTSGVTVRLDNPDPASAARSSGDRNFDKGDVTSFLMTGLHELQLKRGETGLFSRFTYLYDPVIENKDNIPDSAKSRVGHRFRLLDAFVFSGFDIGHIPAHVRLGSQVINWGESTFFGNGINTVNPADASKSRAPGATVKEILLPVPLAWGSLALADNLTVEAFAQLLWDKTQLDPVGTFFSTTDVFGEGANALVLGPGLVIPRAPDHEGSDTGAFGAAAHYTADWLGMTDFGFYYINYSSTQPYLNLRAASMPGNASTAQYFADYPENIHLYGVSFNATLGNAVLAGEYSYRNNLPIGLNSATFIPVFLGGKNVPTYERYGYTQAQMTYTIAVAPGVVPTTSSTTFVVEAGWNKVHGFPNDGRLGTVTKDAWGIQARMAPDWNAAFSVPRFGVFNLKGTLSYKYSVNGVSPAGGAFMENVSVVSVGLEAEHLSKFSVGLVYSQQFGADNPRKPVYNALQDRDFAQLNVKYSF